MDLFPDCLAWYNGQPWPNGPVIALNTSLYTHQYLTVIVPTDMLYLGGQTDAAVARWTAPVSGKYWIFGQFQGLDLDLPNVTVAIYENGTTVLFDNSLAFFGDYQNFILSDLTLKAGTTVDFIVFGGDSRIVKQGRNRRIENARVAVNHTL
jgi:hypothetical protein